MKNKQFKKIYHAAIYVRLSKEDGDVAGASKAESNSISNQKELIRDFLKDKEDIVVVSERVDDGYSGSSFERPGFQQMLEDIRRGAVDCVIVKDLSRFGREYIDTGRYIERLFPALGVRFIAVNDHYDSLRGDGQGDEILVPFKNLINDAYCRDISVKIRSHLEVKRRNGEFIGAFAPYGYQKDGEDRHRLVVDAYAAGVVRDIFRMKLHGMSQDAIAGKLNRDGILSPMEYKNSRGINFRTAFRVKAASGWSPVAVRRILENEVYIGNLVQGRQSTPNHKVKKSIRKDKGDWVRVEKNHEPVVSERDFAVVQKLLGMDTRTAPDREGVYLLSGIAVCGDCGAPMVRKVSSVNGKRYCYYICSGHKAGGNCSPHRIPVQALEDAVFVLLKRQIGCVLDLERVLDYAGTVPLRNLDVRKLEERREKLSGEAERCRELRLMLYEDMKDGVITKEDYVELHAAYEARGKEAQEAAGKAEREIRAVLEGEEDKYRWISYFKEYKDIGELTRNVVVALISEVRVYDRENIEVVFDFADQYRQALEYLKGRECPGLEGMATGREAV
jgi:DNA invertase Pin-like site-specific DNA recombinase